MGHCNRTIAAEFSSCFRGQLLRWCSVLILSTWVIDIAAQRVNNVGVDDLRIIYSGNWTNEDVGGHKVTASPDASLRFEFIGTGISYISRHNWNGGIAKISIDGQFMGMVDQSANTSRGDAPQEASLFSHSGLDESQNHTFQMFYESSGQYRGSDVEVYGLQYTQTEVLAARITSAFAEPSDVTLPGSIVIPSTIVLSVSTIINGITFKAGATLDPSPGSDVVSFTSSSIFSLTLSQAETEASSPSTASPPSSLPSPLSLPSPSSPSGNSKTSQSTLTGGIVGGIFGGALGGILLFVIVPRLFRRWAGRRSWRAIDLERRAQPYILGPDAPNCRRQNWISAEDSRSPMRRKPAMPARSQDALNDESRQLMQQTGDSLAHALGPTHEGLRSNEFGTAFVRTDAQAPSDLNEAPRRASASSDNDSQGNPPSYSHPPSYNRVPSRYAPRRLHSVPVPKT